MEEPEQGKQNRAGDTNRIACTWTVLLVKDSQSRTDGTGQQGQDSQDRTT
jgi:hypothetical protein